MGLFRGFKAKFTANFTPKHKISTSVVPLNFKINSEFESNNSTTITRPVTRSATFDETHRAIKEKLKSKSLSNLSNGPSNSQPIHDEQISRKVTKISSFRKSNISLPTEEYNEQERTAQPLHQYEELRPAEKIGNNYDTPSTLILMTQHSPDRTGEEVNHDVVRNEANNIDEKVNVVKDHRNNDYKENEEFKMNVVRHNINDEYEEDQEFKVNVVRYDDNYASEDESYQEVEESLRSDFTEFSSQAASIFFGSSVAPLPSRPRKVNIRRDDDDEEDEIDC